MSVNIQRLKEDIDTLSTIGRTIYGLSRPAFSDEDKQASDWLIQKMKEAGLEVHVDEAGNIRGRWGGEAGKPAVATGSHIDTVNNAGHLDGALGVLAGLESIRSIREEGEELTHPVELISFSDEEGRFGSMVGSRAMAGLLTKEDVEGAVDVNGEKLTDCMAKNGFDPDGVLKAKENSKNFKAFVELHIEQGPVLEQKQIPVGVVDGITGLFKWQVTLNGQANHAGTTPMSMRRDSFQGLVKFASRIDSILKEHGKESSRTTIGSVQLYPGSPNVVPGQCVFTLEVRDTDQEVLDRLEKVYYKSLHEMAEKIGLTVSINPLSAIQATPCSPEIVQQISDIAEKQKLDYLVMPSGAAHDSQNMAKITPTSMIFVPSIGGVSHSPDEATSLQDIEKGTNLLKSVLLELAL